MNFQELTSLINKVAGAVESSEKFALPVIAAKARRNASERPNDIQIVTAAQVLTKMASTQDYISRDELKGIVNRFTASHSKLANVFADEIGMAHTEPKTFSRDSNEGKSLDFDYQRLADPILSNALAGALEKNPTDTLFSQADAQKAHRAVYAQLLTIGIEPKEVKTFAGRNDILVCQATHETPKGIANVIIPVELLEGKAILPTMFFSQAGFKDIVAEDYIEHVTKTAGKSFTVDGGKLLAVLEQVKNGSRELVNEVEMAAIKIASEKGSFIDDPNGILYTELNTETPDVQLPAVEATEESTFAEKLGKPDGIARFLHGNRVVEAGRSMLTRKISEMGFGTAQVKVAEVEKDKIFYAVAVGTGTGFKVPVEVTGNMAMPPKVAFADGSIIPFTKQAIAQIVKSSNGGNKKALAVANPCYDLKPTELLDIAKESINEGNFTRAEEAINVLAEIDPVAQKVALAYMAMNIYEPGQNPKEDMAEMKKLASQKIKDTGTPYFMTSKVFFPEGV
jgi:hypothetical protein